MFMRQAINEIMHQILMPRHLQSVHNLRQVLLVGHDLRQVLLRLQHHRRCALVRC
jgi:hypothetical protein